MNTSSSVEHKVSRLSPVIVFSWWFLFIYLSILFIYFLLKTLHPEHCDVRYRHSGSIELQG